MFHSVCSCRGSDWMVWGYQWVGVGAHVVVDDKKEAILNVVYLSNKL